MHFKLIIKDYESFTPLSHKHIYHQIIDTNFLLNYNFLEQQSLFRDSNDKLSGIKLIIDYTSLCISLESIELERVIE